MNYIKISKNDIANGVGVRVTLWCSGCSLHCPGCHNQESHDFSSGSTFTDKTMQELLEALRPGHIKGLTLSGGHPLEDRNINQVRKIIETVKKELPNKDIWLYTGLPWSVLCASKTLSEVVSLCDVVVDEPYISSLRDVSLAFRGSSNQHLIDVKRSIDAHTICLWEV